MNIKKWLATNEMIVVYIIACLSLLIALVNPAFATPATLVSLSRAMLVTLMFAMCEMVVIVSGGIDVSFPAIASLSMYGTVQIMLATGADSAVTAFAIALTIGALCGALNAFLIAIVRIPPLIATLGTSSVISGGTLAFIGVKIISNIPASRDGLGKVSLFTYTSPDGVSYALTALFLLPVAICLLSYVLLRHTMLGRGIYAIGGDQRAAHVAGFNVRGTLFFAYMFAGAIAGLGGVTYMALMRQADPNVLMGSEMMVIAAVVMGGTRITGGHGTVVGTILGVTLITLIKNNLIMLGVPTHFQTFVVGLTIVIGTSITSLRAKSSAGKLKI